MSTIDIVQFMLLFFLGSYVILHTWLLHIIADTLKSYIELRTALLCSPSTPPHPAPRADSD